MDILDTTTNTWSEGVKMPKSRDKHDCIAYEYKGEKGVLVAGGQSFSKILTKIWLKRFSHRVQ